MGPQKNRYLCYRTFTDNALERTYVPQLISRYPEDDRSYYPFTLGNSSFIFTQGIQVRRDSMATPQHHAFVLTD